MKIEEKKTGIDGTCAEIERQSIITRYVITKLVSFFFENWKHSDL